LAVEVATGKVRWETKRNTHVSYSTPVVWETGAGKQVAVAGHAKLIGYDLATGQEAWTCAGIPSGCCPSPVVAQGLLFFAGTSPGGTDDGKPAEMPSFDGMLKNLDKDNDGAISRAEGEQAFGGFFDNQDANKDGKVSREEWDTIMKFMTEGKSNGFALKAGGSGDITSTNMVWSRTKGLPYVASALVYQGQYVMVKDGGIVTAYDAETGDEIYQKRAAASGTYYASPVAANGNIYFTSLNDGVVTVIKAGGKTPEIVAENAPLGERVAATPAIAGTTLYVRTAGSLYAFEGR
jgi:outer membrane protein assembly factor BamB